jgi:hypothetical protein
MGFGAGSSLPLILGESSSEKYIPMKFRQFAFSPIARKDALDSRKRARTSPRQFFSLTVRLLPLPSTHRSREQHQGAPAGSRACNSGPARGEGGLPVCGSLYYRFLLQDFGKQKDRRWSDPGEVGIDAEGDAALGEIGNVSSARSRAGRLKRW